MPAALDDVEPDLVVVASGRGRPDVEFDGTDEDWAPFHARLDALVGVRGPRARAAPGDEHVPRLAVLGSAARRAVDRGHIWHPPLGPATFRVVAPTTPSSPGLR